MFVSCLLIIVLLVIESDGEVIAICGIDITDAGSLLALKLIILI